jgi:hypothetical protein
MIRNLERVLAVIPILRNTLLAQSTEATLTQHQNRETRSYGGSSDDQAHSCADHQG